MVVNSIDDATRPSNPSINSAASNSIASSPNVKMTLSEITDNAPHLSNAARRAIYSEQLMEAGMHPLTRSLLEKNK